MPVKIKQIAVDGQTIIALSDEGEVYVYTYTQGPRMGSWIKINNPDSDVRPAANEITMGDEGEPIDR